MSDPLDGYVSREWDVITMPVVESRNVPLMPAEDRFRVCGADSGYAQLAADQPDYDPSRMFFYDLEQMAADHKVHGIDTVSYLDEPWRGYAAGTLAFISYEGITDTPGTVTLFVERVAP